MWRTPLSLSNSWWCYTLHWLPSFNLSLLLGSFIVVGLFCSVIHSLLLIDGPLVDDYVTISKFNKMALFIPWKEEVWTGYFEQGWWTNTQWSMNWYSICPSSSPGLGHVIGSGRNRKIVLGCSYPKKTAPRQGLSEIIGEGSCAVWRSRTLK